MNLTFGSYDSRENIKEGARWAPPPEANNSLHSTLLSRSFVRRPKADRREMARVPAKEVHSPVMA